MLFALKNTPALPDDACLLKSDRLSQLLADSGGGGCNSRCRFLDLSFASDFQSELPLKEPHHKNHTQKLNKKNKKNKKVVSFFN